MNEMKTIFQAVIDGLEIKLAPLTEQTLQISVSLEEKISYIAKTIAHAIKTRFSQLFSSTAPKMEIVVSFLAMLELMKQKNIAVDQNELFAEIEISKIN
jgi:segregation and condensation protein A